MTAFFEEDYIMRMVKELVRALLQLIFHVEGDAPAEELLKDEKGQDTLERLRDMVDTGQINEAENEIYGMEAGEDKGKLRMALLFYSYLNDKDDDFLREHNYSREEIAFGLKVVLDEYGLGGMAEAFLMEL